MRLTEKFPFVLKKWEMPHILRKDAILSKEVPQIPPADNLKLVIGDW
jgi:hypothetical protein